MAQRRLLPYNSYGNNTSQGLVKRNAYLDNLDSAKQYLNQPYTSGVDPLSEATMRANALQYVPKPEEAQVEIDPISAVGNIGSEGLRAFEKAGGDISKLGKKALKKGTEEALDAGKTAAEAATNAAKEGMSDAAKAGLTSAGAAAANIGGDILVAKGKETGGYALKGAATGAQIGSMIPGVGTAVGAAAGAIGGAIYGKVQQDKRETAEEKAEKERLKYNKEISRLKKNTIGQARDLSNYQKLLSSVNYKKGGILKYQEGGNLPAKEIGGTINSAKSGISAQERLDWYNRLREVSNKNNTPFSYGTDFQRELERARKENMGYINEAKTNYPEVDFESTGFSQEQINPNYYINKQLLDNFQKGKTQGTNETGSTDNVGVRHEEKVNQSVVPGATPVYIKSGEDKQSFTDNLEAIKKLSPKTTTATPIFKRGGKADLEKANVIVDGPSHDEENNTGIKGDKGLPVVSNGKKIAEIESDELVLNKQKSEEIERLVALYKDTKDPKVAKQLGELMKNELGNNTYDYSDVL